MAESREDAAPQDTGEEGQHEGGAKISMVPPVRLVVRATAGARVIGKRGESIKAIRAISGVNVKILQDELPEVLKRREECIVMASSGETGALRTAVTAILDRLFDRSGLPDPADRSRDRPYVLDVIVPERAGGHLVGPGGERVKALQEELGCDIYVQREPLAGIADQKRVRFLSRERGPLETALWRLHAILAELADSEVLKFEHFELREAVSTEEDRILATAGAEEVPMKLLLAPGEASAVVGRLGANVMRLRDFAYVTIDNAQAPPFHPAARICSVARASLSDRLRALRLILGDLSLRALAAAQEAGEATRGEEPIAIGSRQVCIRLLLPLDRTDVLASQLHGATSSKAQTCHLAWETGVHVGTQEQDLPDGHQLKIAEISGTEDEVAAACWRLHQALEPWEPVEVPPRYVPPAPTIRTEDERGPKGAGKGAPRGVSPSPARARDPLPPRSQPQLPQRPDERGDAAGSPAPAGMESPLSSALPAPQEPPSRQEQLPTLRASEPRPSGQDQMEPPAPSLHPERSVPERAPEPSAPSLHTGETYKEERSSFAPTQRQPEEHLSFTPTQRQPVEGPGEERRSFTPTQRQPVEASSYARHEIGTSSGLKDTASPSMLVVVPSNEAAAFLVSPPCGIARRANVELKCHPAASDRPPVVEIAGPPHAAALACYLLQVQMWLSNMGPVDSP